MKFHPEIAQGLSDSEQRQLWGVLEELSDQLWSGLSNDEAFQLLDLPIRYAAFYKPHTTNQFYVTLSVLTARFEKGWTVPQCRGEELLLRTILHLAIANESDMGEGDPSGLEELAGLLFEDDDIAYMDDKAFDGIDDTETEVGELVGTGSFAFDDWFKPFNEERWVHPLVRAFGEVR